MTEKEKNSLIKKEQNQMSPFKPQGTDIVPFKKEEESMASNLIKQYRDISTEFFNATTDITLNILENTEKINNKVVDMLVDNTASTLFIAKESVKGIREIAELSGDIGKIFFNALWEKKPEAKKDSSLIPVNISIDDSIDDSKEAK